jgi:trimethylamine---corrinoid protein Co-methyltransferase
LGKVTGLIRILEDHEMKLLHNSALTVLSDVGMRIDHQEALAALAEAGCQVDFSRQTVRFPAEIVERAVARLRADFAPARGAPAQGTADDTGGRFPGGVPMRYTNMYFTTMPRRVRSNFDANTGGFTLFVYDLNDVRRPATMQDVRDSIRLADALPNIDLIGLPCVANEVPAPLRPVTMAAELVKLTAKPGGIEAWSVLDVEYLCRIAEVVAGGSEDQRAEALRARPILVGYGEARSPLTIDRNMAAVFIEYIRRGLPQSLDTMPAGGTTAPATSAGTLTLGLAETLGGLTLAYAIRPDAIVSLDICPTLTNMSNLMYPYAGADRIPLVAAAAQMLSEFYNRPGGCHGGKTDACLPGVQAGAEKALSIIFPILAGATGVGTLGHIENAVTFSYQQLVIDDEIAGYIRRMLRGFEVSAETIGLDVIREVGIGGNYLTHPHTVENYRREFWLPDLMERMPWDSWSKRQVRGMEARAKERAAQILKRHHPAPLTEVQVREIDQIVAAARRDARYRTGS